MKKRNKKTAKILAAVLAAALGVCVPETTLQAAGTLTSVQIQMPGFVVEQFSAPRLMNVTKNAVVRTLPDHNAEKLTSVTAGNTVWGWGQTNTGWYFVQVGSQIGYVRYEAAAYATQDQIAAAQQPRGGLHAVLLQQLLVGAPGLSAHALADIRQRNTISPCHIGKAGLTIILGDLLQRRLHQCIAAHGLHAGGLRGAFKLCHHCICPP